MSKYEQVRDSALELNEQNCCSVIAVSLVTGEPFQKVHRMFKQVGRRDGKPTPRRITWWVVSLFGFNYKRRKDLESDCRTVRTLERRLSSTPGKFLVGTRGHLLAVIDGKAEDFTSGRLHRVKRVYEIFN